MNLRHEKILITAGSGETVEAQAPVIISAFRVYRQRKSDLAFRPHDYHPDTPATRNAEAGSIYRQSVEKLYKPIRFQLCRYR